MTRRASGAAFVPGRAALRADADGAHEAGSEAPVIHSSIPSVPAWELPAVLPPSAPLDRDERADVCVVGAGITGLNIAYTLAVDGRRVLVIDDGEIGGGETSRTTAHLSTVIDRGYVEIERIHGAEGARLAAESHAAAILRCASIARAEGIECAFEPVEGFLFGNTPDSIAALERERVAAERAGVRVAFASRAPLRSFDTGACLAYQYQAQIDPRVYVAGIARAAHRRGVRFATDTHVHAVHGGNRARVETTRGPIVTCDAVVVATNVPINDRIAVVTKLAAYTTYVIAAHVPPGAVSRALYWDDASPYHYLRLTGGSEPLLVVGGEDHRSGQSEFQLERFLKLEAWARKLVPDLGPVERRWSGQCMESVDGLAYIGRNPGPHDNVYIATGDSGQGMTHGTIAGVLVADLIAGRSNAWSALYDPGRASLRSTVRYVRENARTALQYGRWLGHGDAHDARELECGHGTVVRRGWSMVAVWRDESGELHERSAVCPHLGGIVHWNVAARTWDCPCHGARFSATGQVISGPANEDLRAIEPAKSAESVERAHTTAE